MRACKKGSTHSVLSCSAKYSIMVIMPGPAILESSSGIPFTADLMVIPVMTEFPELSIDFSAPHM